MAKEAVGGYTHAEATPEIRAFLAQRPNVILSTVRKDGSPQLSPVWFLFEDDAILISTVKETAKWKNLRRDPRVALCADEPSTGRMVVAYGVAELIEDDLRPATQRLVEKYVKSQEDVQRHMERIFSRWTRVIVRVQPNKYFSRNLVGVPTSELGTRRWD